MSLETSFRNLRKLKDQDLLSQTVKLAREERELLTKVLYHIREIEKRRLFSSLGYKSIFDFAVKKLGYSEDQAYRRVQAARLLNEIPEIEEKINSGKLNLTHLSLAQNLFKSEKKQNKEVSKEQKLEIFEKISSKPVREAEGLLFSYSSNPVELKKDQIRTVSEDHIELKFTASKELLEKIETLKGYLAHTDPNISMGELLNKLCDLGLQHFAPSNKGIKVLNRRLHKMNQARRAKTFGKSMNEGAELSVESPAAPKKSRVMCSRSESASMESYLLENSGLNGRYIPGQIRRKLFQEAKNRCQMCSSTYALEIDHIRPRALNGTNDSRNLRVLCRQCNQRSAVLRIGVRT